MIFSAHRPPVTERMLAMGVLNPIVRFALFPTRLHDNRFIWMEHYICVPVGLYQQDGKLKQYRVGGDWGDDGVYFPHGYFAMADNSYLRVDHMKGVGMSEYEFLLEKAGEQNV